MNRPNRCRNVLKDNGYPYPKSGCEVCGNGGLAGCPYGKQRHMDKLPPAGKKVIAVFKNRLGKNRTICAQWIPRYFIEAIDDIDVDEGCYEYCEEKDEYFMEEGWWECIENWDDYQYVKVCEGEVFAWTELPEW